MKKVFYLVAASLLMSSCLKDRAFEAYNEEFVSVFGETDPLHTWKMVENQSVEVNVEKPSRVKIYVKVDDTYRLAADYENVSGTQSLSYDAPMGCEDIHVTVNGVPVQKGSSRSVDDIDISTKGVYKTFTYKTIEGLYDNFRKEGNLLPEEGNNTSKVTYVDYTFISNGGTYTFYPIYWGGIFHHSYGLYYYDGDEIKHISFFEDHKASNILQRVDNETAADDFVNVGEDYAYNYFFTGNKSYDDSEVVLRSLCYNIRLPKDTQFGFYVDVTHIESNDRGRFYSDPALNKNYPISTFAYLKKDDNTSYITVEDYIDNDYNDFVFVLEGNPFPVVNDPTKYIYAVEDLGGENDFDFNDVVFSVSHISGHEEAIVQPLAAGGIFPAHIRFGKVSKEIHSMFDVETNVMVNTAKGTSSKDMVKANPFKVNVGTKWSHTAYGMGEVPGNGFSVKVDIPSRRDKVVTTYEPGGDIAPQMLVLPENWLWPVERTRISDAYKGFGEWGANYKNQTWVNTPNTNLVINWR